MLCRPQQRGVNFPFLQWTSSQLLFDFFFTVPLHRLHGMFIDCHIFILGYKFRLPVQIGASGWILACNSPERCSSSESTSFLFSLVTKKSKHLIDYMKHKKGNEEQDTGTWILWASFYFLLFQTLLFAVLGNASIVNGCSVFVYTCTCTQTSRKRAEQERAKEKKRNSRNESGRPKNQTNRRRPSGD